MSRRDRLTKEMVLAYYGELPPTELARLEQELEQDPAAAAQYRKMAELLDILQKQAAVEAVPTESDQYWSVLEHTILHRIRQEMRRERLSPWRRLVGNLSLVRVALALGVVAVAFFLGTTVSLWYRPVSPQATDGTASRGILPFFWEPSVATATTSPVINEQLRNFLKQSQLYIATTADKQLECSRCIPIERQVDHRQFAKELLKEAHRLRAVAHHDPKVKKVLQDVEIVLATLSQDQHTLTPEQMEVLHHIASTTVCEVSATVGSTNNDNQP